MLKSIKYFSTKGGDIMQKFMGKVIAFVLVLSFSGLASAVDEKPSDKKARAKTKQITGEVTEFDVNSKTVSVKGKNGTVTLVFTDKTNVIMGRETRSLSDVQIGDRVTIKYRESDGKRTAKRIEIKSIAKKPKLPT
jgi:Cu/Ag efflux protein CusF